MSTLSSSPRVIVVLGATGQQGGGVVWALLKSKSWIVRAGTRNPGSSKAQELLASQKTDGGRLELVAANVYDVESLRKAFSGAYGVFAITSESHPDKEIVDEASMQHEVDAGRNIVRAAKECSIQHFVFSSLPDMIQATSGRFPKLFHMDNKHAVEKIAREELPGRGTFLIPGFFYTNLQRRQYCRLQEDGVTRFCYPIPSDQVAQWTDPEYDMGSFAARVFALGVDQTHGKTYLAMSPRITPREMVETFTRVTGKRAIHSQTTFEEFGDLTAPYVGPAFKEDAMQMMQWAAVAPESKVAYGSLDPHADRSAEELGLTASSFEQWLKRSGWTGPDRP
ncbi:NAD(P)-binding protein [Karstenula rhodostoma CBS 690.94]|uniref:NAD(P)-binding protein n=1 Tax=Karstenula rhodostoma CBS 690.94 TaxID=1392251 RepID=A0A9P4PIX9_9PLEO|nr:NAD(P)-binding protein [Karstenula rhodostoma CBS 690.94]